MGRYYQQEFTKAGEKFPEIKKEFAKQFD